METVKKSIRGTQFYPCSDLFGRERASSSRGIYRFVPGRLGHGWWSIAGPFAVYQGCTLNSYIRSEIASGLGKANPFFFDGRKVLPFNLSSGSVTGDEMRRKYCLRTGLEGRLQHFDVARNGLKPNRPPLLYVLLRIKAQYSEAGYVG